MDVKDRLLAAEIKRANDAPNVKKNNRKIPFKITLGFFAAPYFVAGYMTYYMTENAQLKSELMEIKHQLKSVMINSPMPVLLNPYANQLKPNCNNLIIGHKDNQECQSI